MSPLGAKSMINSLGEGEIIGKVTNTGDITIKYRGKTIDLKR